MTIVFGEFQIRPFRKNKQFSESLKGTRMQDWQSALTSASRPMQYQTSDSLQSLVHWKATYLQAYITD